MKQETINFILDAIKENPTFINAELSNNDSYGNMDTNQLALFGNLARAIDPLFSICPFFMKMAQKQEWEARQAFDNETRPIFANTPFDEYEAYYLSDGLDFTILIEIVDSELRGGLCVGGDLWPNTDMFTVPLKPNDTDHNLLAIRTFCNQIENYKG